MDRYWVGGGSSANWDATGSTNWSDVSGGSNDFSVPTSTDDVYFDNNGNTNSVISATITVNSLTITSGYTATMTHNAVLTIVGDWIMNNTHIIAGISGIAKSGTGTLTSNGQIWPNTVTFGATSVTTLVGDFTMNTALGLNVIQPTINKTSTEKFYIYGISGISGVTGSVTLVLLGGTWNQTGTNNNQNSVNCNVDLQGDITIAGIKKAGGTLTYVSGVITVTAANFICTGNVSFDTGTNVVFIGITTAGTNPTVTLLSDLYLSGSIANGSASQTFTFNTSSSSVIYCYGISALTTISGTAKIVLLGGSWSGGGGLGNNLDLQGNCTISGIVIKSANTITYVSGTITVAASNLYIQGAVTLDTVGMTWSTITQRVGGSIVLISDCTAGGAFVIVGHGSVTTGVGAKFYANGLNYLAANAGTTTGNITFVLTGGSWYCTTSQMRTSFNIDIAGNVAVGATSGIASIAGGTITYISGTPTFPGQFHPRLESTTNLDLDGVIFGTINFVNGSGGTVTLLSNLSCTYTNVESGVTNFNGVGFTYTTTGINLNKGVSQYLSGNISKLILNGGTWSSSSTNLGIYLNTEIAGNVTISGAIYYAVGTLTYLNGTITVSGSSLNLTNSCTLNTIGMTWNNVNTSSTTGYTYTISSTLSANVLNIGLAATQTFTGTAGFNVVTLSCGAGAAQTVNLKESITYTVTGLFNCYQARIGSTVLFTSSHASLKANLVISNNGSSSCNVLADFTRINASGGRSVTTFGGTISDCINVVQYYDYPTTNAA